jgi:hypothetical protein
MIRMLTSELSNTILLLVFIKISLLKKWFCALTIIARCSVCHELKNGTPKRGLEFNVKINVTDSVDWIYLVQNRN